MEMSSRQDVPSTIWTRFKLTLQQIWAIAETDVRKLRHDPWELVTRFVQPAVWLLIFGQAIANARAIPTGDVPYLDYLAPGILAQSILFIAIFYGVALIWERDMGVLHKIMVTPAPRIALVVGRALAAGFRGLSQVVAIYFLSFLIGIDIRWNIFAFLGVLVFVILGAAIFSTFSLIIASIVKKRERFMGIGQVMTMPLFFASNALYPLSIMPDWIKVISKFNPLTYQVDALRFLMIEGEVTQFGLGIDFLVCFVVFWILAAIATPLYPKILY